MKSRCSAGFRQLTISVNSIPWLILQVFYAVWEINDEMFAIFVTTTTEPTGDLQITICRPTVARQLPSCWPTTVLRTTVGRQLLADNCWPTSCWPTTVLQTATASRLLAVCRSSSIQHTLKSFNLLNHVKKF